MIAVAYMDMLWLFVVVSYHSVAYPATIVHADNTPLATSCIVATDAAVLQATLTATGWQPYIAASAWYLNKKSPDAIYSYNTSTLFIFRLQAQKSGPDTWLLALLEDNRQDATYACMPYAHDVVADLLQGLATLKNTVAQDATTILPYIDLRYSPSEIHAEDFAQPLQYSNTLVISNKRAGSMKVALTFDACSMFYYGGAFNQNVIDILLEQHVPATLFIGGHWAEVHPDILQYLANQNQFEIGNHSYSHPHMTQLSAARQQQELLWTQQIIYTQTGILPRYFRAPYGEIDDTLVRTAKDIGLVTVQFDLASGDADALIDSNRLTNWVVAKSQPGSIVVLHMNHPEGRTAEALPHIIHALRQKNFDLVTVGTLLQGSEP